MQLHRVEEHSEDALVVLELVSYPRLSLRGRAGRPGEREKERERERETSHTASSHSSSLAFVCGLRRDDGGITHSSFEANSQGWRERLKEPVDYVCVCVFVCVCWG